MYDQILTKTARPGGWEQGEGKRKKEELRVLTSFGKKRNRSPIRSNNCRPGFEELNQPRGWKNHFVRGVKFSGSLKKEKHYHGSEKILFRKLTNEINGKICRGN